VTWVTPFFLCAIETDEAQKITEEERIHISPRLFAIMGMVNKSEMEDHTDAGN
jgi:hypothetical protein